MSCGYCVKSPDGRAGKGKEGKVCGECGGCCVGLLVAPPTTPPGATTPPPHPTATQPPPTSEGSVNEAEKNQKYEEPAAMSVGKEDPETVSTKIIRETKRSLTSQKGGKNEHPLEF